jgi:microcystin-dependent protein
MKARQILHAALTVTMLVSVPIKHATAASEPFIGEIMWVGYTFCPRGWAPADGQLLQISSHTALFSLYGTIYGGDGRTNFGLPDLRGRAPIHSGSGPGLTHRQLGSKDGTETESLSVNQMPSHSHAINASQGASDNDASGSVPGSPARTRIYDSVINTTLATGSVANTGGGGAHNNMQPFLTLRACVALEGIYPSRN